MRNLFRYSLVGLLVAALAVNPAWAFHSMNCGCYEPEPPCCSSCCSACDSPCQMSPCAAPDCCGEVMRDDTQPAAEKSQHAPSMPDMSAEPTPAKQPEPKAMDMPQAEPPVTDTSNTETEPEASVPAEEAAPTETESESVDELFDSPATDPAPAPETTPPAEEPAAEESEDTEESEEKADEPAEEKDPLDDFFSDVPRPAALSAPGGLESNSHRTWTDNTAKYHCEARLVSVTPREVVLAKANGQLKTVSLRRLSDADLTFVHEQVVAKRELLARQNASEKLASHWAE